MSGLQLCLPKPVSQRDDLPRHTGASQRLSYPSRGTHLILGEPTGTEKELDKPHDSISVEADMKSIGGEES